MPALPVEMEWRDFASKIISAEKLPHGTELRLYKGNTRKRGHMKVKVRRTIRFAKSRLSDTDHVSDLQDIVATSLSTELATRGLDVLVFGPDGKRVYGNTQIATLRNKTPKPTEAEREEAKLFEEEIADAQLDAEAAIKKLERDASDAASIVCPAFVLALVDRYGHNAVRQALADAK